MQFIVAPKIIFGDGGITQLCMKYSLMTKRVLMSTFLGVNESTDRILTTYSSILIKYFD